MVARLTEAHPWLPAFVEAAVNAEAAQREVRLGEAINAATHSTDLAGLLGKVRADEKLLAGELRTLADKAASEDHGAQSYLRDILELFAVLAEVAAHAHERAAPPAPSG